MGWCRIILSPEDRRRLADSAPALLREFDAMNAEADEIRRSIDSDPREDYTGEAEYRNLDTRGFNR